MNLDGRAVFLSASVPAAERSEAYRRVPDAPLRIDEAVVSLARAVFSHNGRLVFGGHPAISPLVAMVAAEYHDRPSAPPRIIIYQYRAFEGFLPDATLAMFRSWSRRAALDRSHQWRGL
jgi:hypothetical protein